MINDQDFKGFFYNVLGAKSKVVGDLILSGDTIITSEISGSVRILDSGKLTLERGSVIQGKIYGVDVDIFGTVEGEIHCTGLVSIRSSGKVTGKLVSGRLVVYPGAMLEVQAASEVTGSPDTSKSPPA